MQTVKKETGVMEWRRFIWVVREDLCWLPDLMDLLGPLVISLKNLPEPLVPLTSSLFKLLLSFVSVTRQYCLPPDSSVSSSSLTSPFQPSVQHITSAMPLASSVVLGRLEEEHSCWQLVPMFRSFWHEVTLGWWDRPRIHVWVKALTRLPTGGGQGMGPAGLPARGPTPRLLFQGRAQRKKGSTVLTKGTQHSVRKQAWHEFTWQFSNLTSQRQLKTL